MQIPPAVSAHLSKINFATLCLAAILFLFPWSNVSCNGKEMGSQSGFQAIYAGFSKSGESKQMDDQMRAMGGPSGAEAQGEKLDDDMGYALVTLLALLAVLAGAALSGMLLFKKMPPAVPPAMLAAAALVLLLFQALVGFPIDRSINRAMDKGKQSAKNDPFGGQMAGSIILKTERTGWYYLELLVLAVPAGLLIYSMIPDRKPLATSPATSGAVILPPAGVMPPAATTPLTSGGTMPPAASVPAPVIPPPPPPLI